LLCPPPHPHLQSAVETTRHRLVDPSLASEHELRQLPHRIVAALAPPESRCGEEIVVVVIVVIVIVVLVEHAEGVLRLGVGSSGLRICRRIVFVVVVVVERAERTRLLRRLLLRLVPVRRERIRHHGVSPERHKQEQEHSKPSHHFFDTSTVGVAKKLIKGSKPIQ
jgi:hypothetical protein